MSLHYYMKYILYIIGKVRRNWPNWKIKYYMKLSAACVLLLLLSHWLPIRQRIQYKLGLLVYKCLHGLAPLYLSDMLALVSADPYSCRLRSAAHGDLTVPWTRTVRMGPRSFAVSGPKFWNSLAPELKHPNISLASFKSLLKTELFIRAYPDR